MSKNTLKSEIEKILTSVFLSGIRVDDGRDKILSLLKAEKFVKEIDNLNLKSNQ